MTPLLSNPEVLRLSVRYETVDGRLVSALTWCAIFSSLGKSVQNVAVGEDDDKKREKVHEAEGYNRV